MEVFGFKVYILYGKCYVFESRLYYLKNANFNLRIPTETKQKVNKPIIKMK